jgi:hypothetical protein
MQAGNSVLTCEVVVVEGHHFQLPESLLEQVGPGRWLVRLEPLGPGAGDSPPVRDHAAFLSGYAPEDEGLYDDLAAR